MRYICLVYFDEQATWSHPEDELMVMVRESGEYDAALKETGQLIIAHALQPAKTAVSVRVRDGKVSATDGPFAETKEVLGGFILIEARDLNEAIEIAGRAPLARFGTIEVRPVLGPSQDPRSI
jgi:hypothetical protein